MNYLILETIVMCLERPLEQALKESPVGAPLSMTDFSVEKGYDFDFKYGQCKEFQDIKIPTPMSKGKRKHHKRKSKGKKKYRFPSTFFEPILENIDEEKEIEIDPLRLNYCEKKLTTKHRERSLDKRSRSMLEDGRRFRHRHYHKRDKVAS